ncbi:hypothetical protein JXM83_01790 [Candidatus Woesearchaeota archaeon]|nr:hypothetical protein [Candidatus Woesearchaeota archaeon]
MGVILLLGAFNDSVFNIMKSACLEFSSSVLSPVVGFSGSEIELYKRIISSIGKSDLIVFEDSLPSETLGLEIRETVMLKKPVLVFLKEGSTISPFFKDCSNVRRIVFYKDLTELKLFLKKELLAFFI